MPTCFCFFLITLSFRRYWGTKKVQMYGHLSIAVSSIIVMILWYPLTDGENGASAYILFFFYLLFYYAVNCKWLLQFIECCVCARATLPN